MSADASPRKRAFAHDQLSALLVAGITILALLLGWGLRAAISNRTRSIQQEGVSAEVPDGWLVQYGAGELLFLARNPRSLDQEYQVTLLAWADDLAAAAQQRSYQRSQRTSGYQMLDETSIVIDGRDGFKVSYVMVDPESSGVPAVIEGAEYYFHTGDRVLVVSLEASAERFTDALPQFFRFMKSVSYQRGG